MLLKIGRFEYLGHGSFFHGVYSLEKTRLIISRSIFLNNQNGGHEIKSRSYFTKITDSVIASGESIDSRLIDIANGGEVILRNNVLVEGSNSENNDLLSWGVEDLAHQNNSLTIVNNLLISDKLSAKLMSSKHLPNKVAIFDNIVVGNIHGVPRRNNDFFHSREELGIKPAPFIPRLK